MSTVGVGFSLIGLSVCDFVLVTLPANTVGMLEGTVSLGMLNREGTDQEWNMWFQEHNYDDSSLYCVPYGQSERHELWDTAWKAGIAMAFISAIIGITATIASYTATCRVYDQIFFKGLAFALMLSGVLSALSLVWFATDICDDFDCEYSTGAGMMTAAALLFICAGLCSMLVQPNHDMYMHNGGHAMPLPGTVTVTETIMPDGTKVTRKTTVNSNYSTTVVETIQTAQPESATNPSPRGIIEEPYAQAEQL